MIHQQIQPLAFRLTTDDAPRQKLWTMRLPADWTPILLELMRSGSARERISVPFVSLRRAAWMLLPDILFIERGPIVGDGSPWLYSSAPADRRAVWSLITAWVQSDFGKASDVAREHVLARLSPERLEWKEQAVNVAGWLQGPNGTAEPVDEGAWRMLPSLVAARLDGRKLALGDESPRDLVRCPSEIGAELLTWPPYEYRPKTGPPSYYSVTVRISAQTVPFCPEPRIHVDMGVRRWVSWAGKSGRVWIPSTNGVYLRSRAAWLPSAHTTRGFQLGRVRRYGREVRWIDPLAALLQRLSLEPPVPSADKLIADPARFLNPKGEHSFAIVHRPGVGPSHPVGAGVNPPDRKALLELVADALSDIGEPIEPLPRQTFRARTPRVRKRSQLENRQLLATATGGKLQLHVLSQRAETMEQLERALTLLIGEPEAVRDGLWVWAKPRLRIDWSSQSLGELGALELPDRHGARAQLAAAINTRCQEIVKRFGLAIGPTGTIVELQPAEEWAAKRDPKFANRVGLARTRRLSQFITPSEVVQEHRAAAALQDLLFRQLGTVGDLRGLAPRGSKLAETMEYLAVWVIRRNEDRNKGRDAVALPVMVRLSPGATGAQAATINPDGRASGWRPYREVLLEVAGREFYLNREQATGKDVGRFITSAIESLKGRDAILFTVAQNLRRLWPVRNDDLPADGRAAVAGLRHVRVRTADQSEAPQFYAGETEPSVATGLWRTSERVFASTGDKPVPQARVVLTQSKIGRPRMQSWNPRILELTVAEMQPGDSAWELAAVGHQLRVAAVHHRDFLATPLPVHLAHGIEEYALPLAGSEEESMAGEDHDTAEEG